MPKEDWKKNTVKKIFTNSNLWPWDDNEIVSILDVGCGLAFKSKFIPAQIHVGVDIHEPYFEHIEADVPYVVVKYDVRKLRNIFIPKSFDLVISLDIIEHLKKKEAINMMEQCEEIARKAVIIETPRGYVPQNIDIQGHEGHEWQTHRSGWETDELEEMGYNVLTREYKMSDVKRHTKIDVDPNIEIIDAIKIFN